MRDLQTIGFKQWANPCWHGGWIDSLPIRNIENHRDTPVRTKTAVVTPANKVVLCVWAYKPCSLQIYLSKTQLFPIYRNTLQEFCGYHTELKSILYIVESIMMDLKIFKSNVNLLHFDPWWLQPRLEPTPILRNQHICQMKWAQERKGWLGTYNFSDPQAFCLP